MDHATTAEPDLPIEAAGDSLHVRRVFGEAYREGDTTIIPVAKIMGVGGSGSGGFAGRAKPLGVYTIREGRVRWEPALDLNRIILGGQIVGAIVCVTIARAVRKKRR